MIYRLASCELAVPRLFEAEALQFRVTFDWTLRAYGNLRKLSIGPTGAGAVRAIFGKAYLPLGMSSEALVTKLVELPKLASEEDAERPGAGRQNCIELEEGNILYSPNPLVKLPAEDIQFLVSQSQGQSRFHKNTAYRPVEDRLTGYTGKDAGQTSRIRGIMREYSRQALALAAELLAPYSAAWRLDFASFRACEEQGRQMRSHARNDLLHVDSFPTRPLNGDRILRIFTNLNPSHPRVWNTSLTFDELAGKFAGDSAIPLPPPLFGAAPHGDQVGAYPWLRQPRAITLRSLDAEVSPLPQGK